MVRRITLRSWQESWVRDHISDIFGNEKKYISIRAPCRSGKTDIKKAIILANSNIKNEAGHKIPDPGNHICMTAFNRKDTKEQRGKWRSEGFSFVLLGNQVEEDEAIEKLYDPEHFLPHKSPVLVVWDEADYGSAAKSLAMQFLIKLESKGYLRNNIRMVYVTATPAEITNSRTFLGSPEECLELEYIPEPTFYDLHKALDDGLAHQAQSFFDNGRLTTHAMELLSRHLFTDSNQENGLYRKNVAVVRVTVKEEWDKVKNLRKLTFDGKEVLVTVVDERHEFDWEDIDNVQWKHLGKDQVYLILINQCCSRSTQVLDTVPGYGKAQIAFWHDARKLSELSQEGSGWGEGSARATLDQAVGRGNHYVVEGIDCKAHHYFDLAVLEPPSNTRLVLESYRVKPTTRTERRNTDYLRDKKLVSYKTAHNHATNPHEAGRRRESRPRVETQSEMFDSEEEYNRFASEHGFTPWSIVRRTHDERGFWKCAPTPGRKAYVAHLADRPRIKVTGRIIDPTTGRSNARSYVLYEEGETDPQRFKYVCAWAVPAPN